MRTFRSDNNAGICPEAFEAIRDANDGTHEIGYGDDAFTAHAVSAFREIFGDACSVWFVATGTAANTLAIASLTEPWQQVLCHANSHYNFDESTAPERITHCRIAQVPSEASKLTPDVLERHMIGTRGDVHHPQPGVVTISNPTEFGTVYTPDEVRAICDWAHKHDFRVHVDGARFANAVASLECEPRELTIDAGVDAMSFGGTKDGLAFGEAVVFFPQGDGKAFERAVEQFPFHRKGTGHLLSKHRFVSAPFARTLSDGSWLRHARHANEMAARLGAGLSEIGIEPHYPVEANGVFASLPEMVDRALRAKGHGYYRFSGPPLNLSRLMCSFDTQPGDIDALLEDVRTELASG